MNNANPHALTILRTRGRRLCKTIDARGEVHGYDDAKRFDLAERQFADLAELHDLLAELSERRDCCAVRGGIADPARTRGVRRLLHGDGGDLPTLADVPRAWLALDIDGMPLPNYIDMRSVFECAMVAINALPAPFRGAGFVAQATGSHGIKPGAHLRLWTILDRTITCAEAGRWLALIRKQVPSIDPASARPAQIVYTAAPVFEGRAVPIKTRLDLMPGASVPVPSPAELAAPPPPPPRPMPKPGADLGNYARAAAINAATRIMRAPEGARHRTLLSEARGLFRLVEAGAIAEGHARVVIEHAAASAGKNDVAEIAGLLTWAASHHTKAGHHG